MYVWQFNRLIANHVDLCIIEKLYTASRKQNVSFFEQSVSCVKHTVNNKFHHEYGIERYENNHENQLLVSSREESVLGLICVYHSHSSSLNILGRQ